MFYPEQRIYYKCKQQFARSGRKPDCYNTKIASHSKLKMTCYFLFLYSKQLN